jgi:hypothetical protein
VNVQVLMVHAFLHQEGVAWDTENAMVQVGSQANDMASVKVNGIAQVFGHMSRAALDHANMHAGVPSPGCPKLGFPVNGVNELSCVMAAGFFDQQPSASASSNISMGGTVVLLNKCQEPVTVSLPSTLQVLSSITYEANDKGGWAQPPKDPDALPWPGPLSPRVHVGGDHRSPSSSSSSGSSSISEVVLPAVSLTFTVVNQ